MTTTETNIPLALQVATKAIANTIGFTDAMIDWDADIPFKGTGEHLEVRHFPNAPQSPHWGEGGIFVGIWQISLVTFKQKGEIPAMTYLGQLIDVFDKDAEFWSGSTRVQITRKPTVLNVVQEGQKSTYPLSIPYRCTA